MKKLFTLVAAAVMAMAANAKDYEAEMTVVMEGNPLDTLSTTISVTEQGDNKYTLALNNFVLAEQLYVGNIVLSNVEGTTASNGRTRLSTNQTITITAGDDNTKFWYGPHLGSVPVSVNADMTDTNLYAVIKIESFGGIDVVFGDGNYQIKNSRFENFHTATAGSATSDEPDAWHSFMSSTGRFASFVNQTPKTFISNDVRSEATDTCCVLIKSSVVDLGLWKIAANGTITTGQMQAGAMDAADPANCAFLNIENTAVDGNGDPFYTLLNGTPDSLTVWVKFKQGQDLGDNKYATVSAAITDGTRYQDPEDPSVTYNNVVAKAQNAQIESKDFTWQRISIPFDYDTYASNGAATKAILVTISTNAQPGVGSKDSSNPDMLYVDDIELIYNANMTSFNIKGQDITFEDGTNELDIYSFTDELTADDVTVASDGRGAIINKTVEQTDGGYKVTVTVTSNDYKTSSTYTVYLYKAAGEPMSFTDKMNVTMGDNPVATDLEATITIQEQADGTYTLSLKNFMLGESGVGNITVEGVTSAEEGGVQTLSVENAAITITEGDIEGVDWSLGQTLAQQGLKANISGEIENGKLNVKIEIPDVFVTVLFGENYTSGINEVTTVTENGTEAIYDLDGRKLNEMQKGINIVRKADGTTVKVLKK